MNLNIQLYFDIFLNEDLEGNNWKLDDDRTSIACISDAKENGDLINKVFRRISPDSFKYLNSFHIYNTFGKWHPLEKLDIFRNYKNENKNKHDHTYIRTTF